MTPTRRRPGAPNPYDLSTWRGRGGGERDPRPADRPGADDSHGEVPGSNGEATIRPGTAGSSALPTSAAESDDESDYDPPPLPADLGDRFELARRVVNQSRAAARNRGQFPISRKTQMRDSRDRSRTAPGYSGARPDPRDPQDVSAVMRRVLGNLGWNEGVTSGRVLEEWDDIVGDQLASHCRPVSFEEGVLVVSASSSAWATQLRMIAPQLVTRIHEHVGANVISEIKVAGPAAAQRSWIRGRRTVHWRGVRDTYG